jgi:hypothetical protein
MLGPPPWHTKCTAKSSAVGVSGGAHGKVKAHGILPSGAGCVCTRQRAGSRQTASRAHNLSLSLSGRCCLLYFVMRRFSAHKKAFVVGLRCCARHSFFVVACVAAWRLPCKNAQQRLRGVFAVRRRDTANERIPVV